MSNVTPKDLILYGIKYIEQHGWCQHTAHNRQGQVCAVGSLMFAEQELAGGLVSHSPLRAKATALLNEVVAEALSDYPFFDPDITDYNDRNGRTKEEVIEVMRMAADRA